MNPSIKKIRKEVENCIQGKYLSVIEQQLDEEVQKMRQVVKTAESFHETLSGEKADHRKIADYKSQIHALIDSNWGTPTEKVFSEVYGPFLESLQSLFARLETKQIHEQKKERYDVLPRDTSYIKLLKLLKRNLFYISSAPLRLFNLFKKEKSKIRYWNHVVPFKNLVIRHFLIGVLISIVKVNDLVFSRICNIYVKIKGWEEELNETTYAPEMVRSIQGQIDTFKENLLLEIHLVLAEILDTRVEAFWLEFEKAGTIEYSNRILSDSTIEKKISEGEEKWSNNYFGWENTAYALFEDWRSDLDICSLKHQSLAEFADFEVARVSKLEEQIIPKIIEINEFIRQTLQSLGEEEESVQKQLKKINYQASKKLDKELVPQLSEYLSSQPINNLVNKLELSIRQYVEELSSEHVIVKTTSYDYPIEAEELKKISTYELIVFETLTVFQNELKAIKKELFAAFETANTNTKDLDHIVIFSLSSAISALEEGGNSEVEVKSIALEGLHRASNRLSETKEKLETSLTQQSDLIQKAIDKFCVSIMELTVSENALELRLRITKAKATKQAKKAIWQLREKISTKKEQIQLISKKTYQKIQILALSISDKFILTASKPVLTQQVSDFLVESQQAMNNLPVIYKRLYQIEPLQDLELFEGRETEFKSLSEAFRNWEQGRFAATAILGEKWGGLTTFINYSLKKANFPYPVKRFAPKTNICSEEEFMDMLNHIFKTNEFENIEQVIEYLNSGSKKIVIIEDIQNLYLRKVHGFTALQLLFQLTARTFNKVFWIMSTTIYTWQYLTKTINIPEFFSYVIEMGELTHEQVTNIIWKRNRISGFNILFDVDQGLMGDKKFSKLDTTAQQAQLKKDFFSSLNSFAKSNVSLALIFWLLSTKRIDEDAITVGSFQKPDLNFLNVVSMDKVYVLHALILHDGLTESQLNEVLNTSKSSIRLLLVELLQDGIVLQKEAVYLVNPLVYRNLIALLISKNLIH